MMNHLSPPASLMPKYPTLPIPTSSKDPNLYLSVDCSTSIAGLKANNLRGQDVMRPLYACLITAHSAEHGSSVIEADRRRSASSSVQMFVFRSWPKDSLGVYLYLTNMQVRPLWSILDTFPTIPSLVFISLYIIWASPDIRDRDL